MTPTTQTVTAAAVYKSMRDTPVSVPKRKLVKEAVVQRVIKTELTTYQGDHFDLSTRQVNRGWDAKDDCHRAFFNFLLPARLGEFDMIDVPD